MLVFFSVLKVGPRCSGQPGHHGAALPEDTAVSGVIGRPGMRLRQGRAACLKQSWGSLLRLVAKPAERSGSVPYRLQCLLQSGFTFLEIQLLYGNSLKEVRTHLQDDGGHRELLLLCHRSLLSPRWTRWLPRPLPAPLRGVPWDSESMLAPLRPPGGILPLPWLGCTSVLGTLQSTDPVHVTLHVPG